MRGYSAMYFAQLGTGEMVTIFHAKRHSLHRPVIMQNYVIISSPSSNETETGREFYPVCKMYLLKHKTGDSFYIDFTKYLTEIDFKLSSYIFT